MKTLYFGITLLFIFSLSAQAEETKKTESKAVPVVMYDFLGRLTRLQPYMVSAPKFIDPKNHVTILTYLKELEASSKRLPHSERLANATFQIPADALQKHFTHLVTAFETGRKNYARKLLNATIQGCGSCHTQVPDQKGVPWKFKSQEIQGTTFEHAEFYFATRHYDEALKAYSQVIANPSERDKAHLETALKRMLVIYVRIKLDLKSAAGAFQENLKIKDLRPSVRKMIQGWLDAIKQLEKETPPSVETAKPAEIEMYVSRKITPLLATPEKRFDPGNTVVFLQVSGLLYRYAHSHAESDLTAGILYWLAVSDARIEEDYFFALANDYLKACIRKYPADPMALKCYKELESSITNDYSGSAGMNVPSDIEDELKELQKLISPK